LMSARGAAATVYDIIDRRPVINASEESAGMRPPDDVRCRGEVKFDGVSFAYPNRTDAKVLSGVSFSISARAEGGKSSIVKLLLRFYDPPGGQRTLDGHDLRDLNAAWLRSKIGVVSQEPVLFAVQSPTMSAWTALRQTMSEIEDCLPPGPTRTTSSAGLPAGYETRWSEHGAKRRPDSDAVSEGRILRLGTHDEVMERRGLYTSWCRCPGIRRRSRAGGRMTPVGRTPALPSTAAPPMHRIRSSVGEGRQRSFSKTDRVAVEIVAGAVPGAGAPACCGAPWCWRLVLRPLLAPLCVLAPLGAGAPGAAAGLVLAPAVLAPWCGAPALLAPLVLGAPGGWRCLPAGAAPLLAPLFGDEMLAEATFWALMFLGPWGASQFLSAHIISAAGMGISGERLTARLRAGYFPFDATPGHELLRLASDNSWRVPFHMAYQTRSQKASDKGTEMAGQTAAEAIENLPTVQSLGREEVFYTRYRDFLSESHIEKRLFATLLGGLTYGFSQASTRWSEQRIQGVLLDHLRRTDGGSDVLPEFRTTPRPASQLVTLSPLLNREPLIDNRAPESGDRPQKLIGELRLVDVDFEYPQRAGTRVAAPAEFDDSSRTKPSLWLGRPAAEKST
uniref:ABC transporter domain-containing protein n=1 Tax=Macrostomum lignano TaxID=282301 RepID=A0A1I8FLP1_9PLAT